MPTKPKRPVYSTAGQARTVVSVTTLIGVVLAVVGMWLWVPFAGSAAVAVPVPAAELLTTGPTRGGHVRLTDFKPDPSASLIRPHTRGRLVTYYIPLRADGDTRGAVFVPLVREPKATADELRAGPLSPVGMLCPADDLSGLSPAFPSTTPDLTRSWLLEPSRTPTDGHWPLVMLVLGLLAFGFGLYGLAFVPRADAPPATGPGRWLYYVGRAVPIDRIGRWLMGLSATWRHRTAIVLGLVAGIGVAWGVWVLAWPSPTLEVTPIHTLVLAVCVWAVTAALSAGHLVRPRSFGRMMLGGGAIGTGGC